MTHIPSIQLLRLQHPPPGHDEVSYARWQAQFRALMGELKHTARKVVARSRNAIVTDLLDSVQQCRADPIGFGLVEHLYEFTAFHVPGPSGRTIAECAVDAGEHLPETIQGYVEALAASRWELYEAAAVGETGAISLRRLHDDHPTRLDAIEMPQPFVAGTVQALRLFDAGGFQAAPVALALEQHGVAGLVNQLEVEQPAGLESRAEYMRRRGSALILRHALQRHIRRLGEHRPMPEPSVSLVESGLPAEQWRQLDGAFSLLEAAIGDKLSSLSPLALTMPGGRVMRVVQNGRSMALMLFACADEHDSWENARHARAFVRAWRAHADELFAEDVTMLERLGLGPRRDGAAVATRLEAGVWEDVGQRHIRQLIEACRWAAVRVRTDGELAA